MNSLKIINRCHESTSKGWKAILNNDEIEEIKKDLEVLTILKKHLRFMGENKTSLKLINNGCVSNDLVKVKQWLEENEDV